MFIETRITRVNIFLIQSFGGDFDPLAEALIVDNLPLPQKFDRIAHIRIVDQPQQVVVGDPGFLFWYDH